MKSRPHQRKNQTQTQRNTLLDFGFHIHHGELEGRPTRLQLDQFHDKKEFSGTLLLTCL